MLFGGRLAVSPLSILGISGGQGKHIERTLSCIRNAPRCGRFGSDKSADGTQLKALLAPYPPEENDMLACQPTGRQRQEQLPERDRAYRWCGLGRRIGWPGGSDELAQMARRIHRYAGAGCVLARGPGPIRAVFS